MVEIECLWECDDGLGETPIWVEEEAAIYWADHVGASIDLAGSVPPSLRRLSIATGERKTWPMPEQIGSFGVRRGGGFVCGANSGFCTLSPQTGELEHIVNPEPSRAHNRLNDGKIDRRGRFWCGSMDSRLTDKTGYIYCLEPNLTYRKVAEHFAFVCSNGIAFDPEDTLMYFGDTSAGMIYVFDFDIDEGTITNQRPFFSVEDRKPAIVDGATVDSEGYYWFALNLGGKIVRVDPNGRLDREIDMPVRGPTCVTFGGENYETLFVTSQHSFLTSAERVRHPRPGGLFAIHGLGVRGLPEPKFGS